jgi:hypothetical protein
MRKDNNGGIALSGALSLVCISMIARIWQIAMAAKQKFWMQSNNIIVQLFFYCPNLTQLLIAYRKIESYIATYFVFYINHGWD